MVFIHYYVTLILAQGDLKYPCETITVFSTSFETDKRVKTSRTNLEIVLPRLQDGVENEAVKISAPKIISFPISRRYSWDLPPD